MKYLYIVLHFALLLEPILVTWICLTVAKRRGVITVGRYGNLFFVFLAGLFYIAYFFSDYAIPRLNQSWHGIDARIMGVEGFLQDFLVPIVALVPLYYLLNFVFKVNAKSKYSGLFFLFIYYLANYIIWNVYLSIITRNVY